MKNLTILSLLILLGAALSLGCNNNNNNAQANEVMGNQIPFSAATIIIEVNSTDGDSGIQIFLDGEGWNLVDIMDPNGSTIVDVMGEGSVGLQGITEFFFESAEPSFDDLPLDQFLARFPEGEYKFVGMTTEGDELVGTATLTHILPCGPEIKTPEEDEEVDPEDTVIAWEEVTKEFDPDGECTDSEELEIVGYQVIVLREEPEPILEFSVTLPPTAREVTVPSEFLLPETEYKFEILAIEASGNQTLTESTFTTP
jgi:hypothetical protein